MAHIPYVITSKRKNAYGQVEVFIDPQKNQWAREIVHEISSFVHEENVYLKALKSQLQQTEQLLTTHATIILKSEIPGPALADKATYVLPAKDENLGIVVDGFTDRNRDIKLTWSDGSITRMNTLHPFYDPSAYVVLFPHGNPGFHENLPLKRPNKKTARKNI